MTTPPYYYPPLQLIYAISLSNPAIITTFRPHGYKTGLIVRIVIPSSSRATPGFIPQVSLGMPQINGKIGEIVVTGNHTFSFPIDSTGFTDYVPTAFPHDDNWIGQVIPIAENAMELTTNTSTSVTINNNIIPPETYPPPLFPTYR